jgi:hypothetical protein
MAFASGFFLLTQRYREEPRRSELKNYLEQLGFEVYEVGKPSFLVFYVEAPSPKALEDVIKTAERHEGVAKAYIVFGFLSDDSVREWLNEAIVRGEVELDKSTLNYIRGILSKLTSVKRGG